MSTVPRKTLRRQGGPGLPVVLTLPDLFDRLSDLHDIVCELMPDFTVVSIDWPEVSNANPIGRETSVSALSRYVREEIAANPGVPLYAIACGAHGGGLLYSLMLTDPALYRNNILMGAASWPPPAKGRDLNGTRVLLCDAFGSTNDLPGQIEGLADDLRAMGAKVDTYRTPSGLNRRDAEEEALLAFFA